MSFYLAYGSNLNVAQMARRCPGAVPVGTCILKDYQLNFRGSKTGSYLTIDPSAGDSVPLAVWKISRQNLLALDRYEGYPTFYRREVHTVKYRELNTGKPCSVKAYIYIMNGDPDIGVPSERYVGTCMDGYDFFGFPRHFLYDALNRTALD